jgi:preprotein translocase subunit SecG
MEVLILVVHVAAALGIIGLVLLQHGKGADMGAAFGSGSAGSVFGSSGSANFMSRSTAILAIIFFASSIGLTVFSTKKADNRGVMTQPVEPSSSQSLPGQVPVPVPPTSAPAPVVPLPLAVPAEGSKAGEVPK